MKKIHAPLILVVLTATLSACNNNTPTTPINPSTSTINGQVISGSGTGTVSFHFSSGQSISAPVSATGNFSLGLPGADKFSSEMVTTEKVLSKVGCSGNLTSSIADAKGYAMAGLQLSRGSLNDTILAGTLTVSKFFGLPTSGSFDGRLWLYTDKATQLSGQVNCTQLVGAGVPVNITVNATTAAGWNILSLTGKATLSTSGVSVTGNLNGANDGTTTWRTLNDLKSDLNFK